MKKLLLCLIASVATIYPMESGVSKQEQEKQQDEHNIKLFEALNAAIASIATNNSWFLALTLANNEVIFSPKPEFKEVSNLLANTDTTNRKHWYEIIKIAMAQSLPLKQQRQYVPFNAAFAQYVWHQNGNPHSGDGWLQEISRIWNFTDDSSAAENNNNVNT